jgi:sugar phosphate permease
MKNLRTKLSYTLYTLVPLCFLAVLSIGLMKLVGATTEDYYNWRAFMLYGIVLGGSLLIGYLARRQSVAK